MIKSFTLIPSDDILSYQNHEEYPFILFPTVIFIYKKNYILRLDQKDLSLLYHTHSKVHNSIKNKYIFKFKSICNPSKIILEESQNYNKLNHYKYREIKELLPLPTDINSIIIKYIQNENIYWKLTKKRTSILNPITIYKYPLLNEKKLYTKKLKIKKKKSDIIIYGEFKKKSYIPDTIRVIYSNFINNINISDNKDNRFLYFSKEYTEKTSSTDDENDDFLDENEELFYNFYNKLSFE